MTDPRVIPIFEADAPGWAAAKLRPRETGLPMAVWLSRNDGHSQDVCVLVDPLPYEIVPGSPTTADVARVVGWIELNRDAVVAYWTWTIGLYELRTRLQRLP
jgi:hypothetical protein